MCLFKHKAAAVVLPLCILYAFANAALARDLGQIFLPHDTVNPPSRKLSSRQLDEAKRRIDLANAIAGHVATDAESRSLPAAWRIDLVSTLSNLSSAQLRSIEPSTKTLDDAYALVSGARNRMHRSAVVAKDLGDSTDDLVFTPQTPCRFMDTRVVGGGIATTRDFDTSMYGSIYGGSSSCKLPGNTGEYAIAANVTVVVGAGAAGYIGIRPYGNGDTTSFLNWPSGGTSGLANAGIITTAVDSSSDSSAGNYVFEVFNGGTTSPQVIMDYFGYFAAAAEPAMALQCVGAGATGASVYSTVAAGQQAIIDTPACQAGYQAVSGYCYTNDPNTVLQGSGAYFCAWRNSGSASSSVLQNTVYCRTPAF